MNVLTDYIKIDKGHLQSLLREGAFDWTVYNMLTEGKVDCEDAEDIWSRKKKPKGVKGRKVKARLEDESPPLEPLVEDSAPLEPVDTKKSFNPEHNEAWDVVETPPTQLPNGVGEDLQSAEDDKAGEEKQEEVRQVDAAGWAFTWCFRCKRIDVLKFSDKILPEWFMKNLNFKGARGDPIVLPVCCVMSNDKHRQATVSVADEEKRLRQAFETLRVSWDSMGEEALRVAKARVGREVSMIQWGGRAGSVDIEMIKKNLSPEDIAVSIDLKAYREGKEGSDLELGGLAGGLF